MSALTFWICFCKPPSLYFLSFQIEEEGFEPKIQKLYALDQLYLPQYHHPTNCFLSVIKLTQAVSHADECIAPWQSSQYTYSQACNAVGTSAGLCVNLTAGGDLCTSDYGTNQKPENLRPCQVQCSSCMRVCVCVCVCVTSALLFIALCFKVAQTLVIGKWLSGKDTHCRCLPVLR